MLRSRLHLPLASRWPATLAAVLLVTIQGNTAGADSPAQRSPSGSALRSIFSAAAAPPQKTMGLLQRSFVEVAQDTMLGDLEIAVVIDGTDSMADEIEGIRQSLPEMLDDLRRGRDGEVRVAVVVFRDSGSPSGIVNLTLDRFTADTKVINQTLQQIMPEDGAPFFHEMPDVGIHEAISQLPWSAGSDSTRWMFLFTDAPPYPENFATAELPQARRGYATDLLVNLANHKEIHIHCLLCRSTEALSEVYEQALAETRSFMHDLSSGTGGLFLDLSYADVRQAIAEAGSGPRHDYIEIAPISEHDLQAARVPAGQPRANEASGEPPRSDVRIAVLPHMPMNQLVRLRFTADDPAVEVATALRHKLTILPQVRVVNDAQIERALRRLRADSRYDEQEMLTALASQTGADFVFWGETSEPGPMYSAAVYSRQPTGPALQVDHSGDVTQLAVRLLTDQSDDQPLATLISDQLGMTPEQIKQHLQARLARDLVTTRELLVAMNCLQRLLGLLANDPASGPLLEQAQASAEAALRTEPTNGLAHWLLSNIHFNQATRAQAAGDDQRARQAMAAMRQALQRANTNRRQIDSPSLQGEIRADYTFLVQRDTATAIKHYETLMNRDDLFGSDVRRRAHWMLTGIYSGDWGVDETLVDPAKARQHAIAILSHWEDSPEAELLRSWLGWDPSSKETKHPFLPKSHGTLASYLGDAPQAS